MNSLAFVAAVGAAHYAYYAFPAGSVDRQWAFYVGTHALLVVCMLALLPRARKATRYASAAVFACMWGAVESLQAVVCGLYGWGGVPKADLCPSQTGPSFYPAIAAASLAALLMLWRRRRG